MTADGSKGVILWSEDIENQFIARRLDFTVDNSGVLALGQPVTVLPLAGEEPLPGDTLTYFSIDIWGNATHDSLYVTIWQVREFNSGPNAGTGTSVALIYDLNDLTDVTASPDTREIYNEDAGGWQDANGLDCSSVLFPQFVPTCYQVDGLRVTPSGTRLYIADNINDPDGQRWDAALRIHIDMGGGQPLDQWTISEPELVQVNGPNPYGIAVRPDNDPLQLPSPEYIASSYEEIPGDPTTGVVSILDADQCAADYAPYASGTSEAPIDLWQGCLDTNMFFPPSSPAASSWQTPEALLRNSSRDHDHDLYRSYVTGALAGTEQLVIETAGGADTGN
ncbi:MAG: hypothetical protein V3R81_03725 [Gammaproteobacteria bacterium]